MIKKYLIYNILLFFLINNFVYSQDDPSINITYLPEYATTQDIVGEVSNVEFASHKVAVYINVAGGWWNKPTHESPTVDINPDGSWTCDITHAETDIYADQIAVFLIPSTQTPPIAEGTLNIPEEIYSISLDYEITERNPEEMILNFANYEWLVKRCDFKKGPGPNYFSDKSEDVWIDQDGLHLTIKYYDEKWFCTEVILQEHLGYGTYVFYTNSRVDIIDPNMVLGFFTWDGGASAPFREMDFEFSRWEHPENSNAQFVIQPYYVDGNIERYNCVLTDEDCALTNIMDWQEDAVYFATYRGHHALDALPEDKLVHSWKYTGANIPTPGNEEIRMNLWLIGGNPPQNAQGEEALVSNFIYVKPPLSVNNWGKFK